MTASLQSDRSHEREAAFHDDWAASVDVDSLDLEKVWEGVGCPEVAWIDERLGSLEGKRVLDLGAGLGEASIHFADAGAEVTALDISPGMLDVISRVAASKGLDVKTVVGSATDLSAFDEESFDVVYGANMLHHVDISACLAEVRRVLKPGGVAAFWDPVKYNPAIEVYRRLATGMRTPDEHPLRRADVATMERTFSRVETRGFWLVSLAIFGRFFLVDRIAPSAERYWKLVIDRQDQHRRLLTWGHRVDQRLLRLFPPLRWMCWNIAVVCHR